ncbi:nuclear transport factor 2 family protein [Striga asiatica]|uniref:Nuclear transport factor 2 family protein n=1 Tax=Striga asiatica TaxID=4170 RepID=A0A5A7QR44_STRAF|nr:nuclear transport factor 2 family protein [Striga asiatica]
MASFISVPSVVPNFHCSRRDPILRQKHGRKIRKLRCCSKRPINHSSPNDKKSEPEKMVLKIAWYGSELLGVAASLLRSPAKSEDTGAAVELAVDGLGKVDRAAVVETIKEDFRRSYFVTGNLALDAYEEDCEFADPAGSFRGLSRFKRNCTNFGYLIERSDMKLMKWEDFKDKGIGHWRFSCVMAFPWKPILSECEPQGSVCNAFKGYSTGYTEYYFDEKSGRVCRHAEHWNVPKMALLKQLLRPSRGPRK